MQIYPAIDLKSGKCVRLEQGDFSKTDIYSDLPADIAKQWESMGSEYLHVVDLDGARHGSNKNYKAIKRIINSISIPLQVGGGIRDFESLEMYLTAGVTRVIIGTSAVKDPAFVKEAVKTYGKRIVIGIDARDGHVAIEGWEETSKIEAIEFAMKMESLGVRTIVYTDISRDGMLTGPNINAMKKMKESVNCEVIASGGVGCIEDIKDLKDAGITGVIVGKALYTGKIDLRKAIDSIK
jgi:phosphoribosylformimino-5-aminoimidazole carboxamide ribotide isomerase